MQIQVCLSVSLSDPKLIFTFQMLTFNLKAEAGRERQRQVEKGRRRQRQVEKGRGRQKQQG